MKKIKYLFKNKILILCLLIVLSILITYFVNRSYSINVENDIEVDEYSELTYYLKISYDGIDIEGVSSDDTKVSKVSSDVIYVEDTIPKGLLFLGFVTTDDGSIGAVKQSDGSYCPGMVVDDDPDGNVDDGVWDSNNENYNYHGIHYNKESRKVNFYIKNLQAGCFLTVGVKTMTLDADDPDTEIKETRRDFYNYFFARENEYIVKSNTVHTFIGDEEAPLYDVNYEYEGEIPKTAPSAPLKSQYAKDSTVGVAPSIEIPGYEFSGWETTDVNVSNSLFAMPEGDVNFVGSFDEIPKNKVKYVIDGDIPNGYVIPSEKEYYPDAQVSIDSLSNGAEIRGYRFSGWETTDVTFNHGYTFNMPDHDVTLRGSFEEIKYTVTYAFYDTVVPSNASSLLPAPESYKPGSIVKLPTVNNPDNYHFIGWYKEDNFEMPNEDIVIYGEWRYQSGTFEPTITIEIENQKNMYTKDDEVIFIIKVINPSSFAIKDVYVKENNNNTQFITGDGYVLDTIHIAKITSIPANGTAILKAKYKVSETDIDRVNNEVELVGARSDNGYLLYDKEYKASTSFAIKTKLITHHYIEGTTTKVHEDQVEEYAFASVYLSKSLSSNELEGEYKNKYHVNDNVVSNASGIMNKNLVEVTYYYTINKYNINVRNIGGVGTVTGSEEVVHGNDSKENNIVITPSNGYGISKILVDGKEVTITNNLGMTLENFKNVQEDHTVEVEFKELKAPTPITGKQVSYILIAIALLTIAACAFMIYRKNLKR